VVETGKGHSTVYFEREKEGPSVCLLGPGEQDIQEQIVEGLAAGLLQLAS